jgi:hypothetical protein
MGRVGGLKLGGWEAIKLGRLEGGTKVRRKKPKWEVGMRKGKKEVVKV